MRSLPIVFSAGSWKNGVGLGTAQGVAANAVNYDVVLPATAEQVTAGKQRKPRKPYMPVDCPLCKVTLVGEDKRKHLASEAGCGFKLLVAKFALKKVNKVPETPAQCGWIALQDASWAKKVIAALKWGNKGKSNITHNKGAVTETMLDGTKNVLPSEATLKAAPICQWDRKTQWYRRITGRPSQAAHR